MATEWNRKTGSCPELSLRWNIARKSYKKYLNTRISMANGMHIKNDNKTKLKEKSEQKRKRNLSIHRTNYEYP